MSDYDAAFSDAFGSKDKSPYDAAFADIFPSVKAAVPTTVDRLEAAKIAANEMGGFDKFVAAYGGAVPSLWRGIKQAVTTNPSELKKLQEEESDARIMREALGAPGTFGHILGSMVPAAASMAIPGANTVVGAGTIGALQGATEPLIDGESRLGRAAFGGILGGGLQAAIPKAAQYLANRSFKGTEAKWANEAKDTIQKDAIEKGLVSAPSESGGGWLNNMLESIAGKAALKQDIQRRNAQNIRENLVPEVFGQKGTPVTSDSLLEFRKRSAKSGYAPLENMGQVNWTPEYLQELKNINSKYGRPNALTSGERVPAVGEMVSELNVPSMTGQELVSTINNLREIGNKNKAVLYGEANAHAKRSLGGAQVSASNALEELAAANLLAQGRQDLIPALKQSRAEIRKAYDVEKMLNNVTGDIDPSLFIKNSKEGKMQSGNLKTIGDFGAVFPNALSKNPASIPTPGVSALNPTNSALLAAAGSMATGSPKGMIAAGIPMLRDPIRSLLLSKPYQKYVAIPYYPGHSLMGITPGMLDNEMAQFIGRSVAPQLGLLSVQ